MTWHFSSSSYNSHGRVWTLVTHRGNQPALRIRPQSLGRRSRSCLGRQFLQRHAWPPCRSNRRPPLLPATPPPSGRNRGKIRICVGVVFNFDINKYFDSWLCNAYNKSQGLSLLTFVVANLFTGFQKSLFVMLLTKVIKQTTQHLSHHCVGCEYES